jgi:aerobic-type carbon monoxide dehydrogenase small subunit (CoxS/CutS family)
MCITLTVKAERRGVDRGPRVNSLDLLSEHLDLAASNNGCDERARGRRSHRPARLAALHGRERSR